MHLSGFRKRLAARARVLAATEATGLHKLRNVGLPAACATSGALPPSKFIERKAADRRWTAREAAFGTGRSSTCRWDCR